MQTKKKKMLTTGLAVALAALLLIGGGTFAYLQSESKAVANQFKTNEVQVELTESGNGQYNIIPGTSETKDPDVYKRQRKRCRLQQDAWEALRDL